MDNDLFKVELNEEGAELFRRLSRLSLIIVVVTLLLGSLQAGSILYLFLKQTRRSTAGIRFNRQFYFAVGSAVLSFLLQAVQIILYRRFIKTAFNAINHSDSTGFNGSFRLLYLQAIWYLMQLGVTLLFLCARFFL